jgi:outer membrane lipoprotein carrier protein
VPGLLLAPLVPGPGPDAAAFTGARAERPAVSREAAADAARAVPPPARAAADVAPPVPVPARVPAADPQAGDGAAILARAADRHRSLRTLRTSFTQRIRNPVLECEETSRGVFSYRSPLRYRIAFTSPADDVIVSDGSRVWIYLPSSQPGQVIRSPVEGARGFAPYQFLDEFRGRYDAALVGKEPAGGRPSWHLVLTPQAEDAAYARAEIWVDVETSLTTAMEVEEPNGVVRRFTLDDHRVDTPLADSLFRFSPPSGVEVFDR